MKIKLLFFAAVLLGCGGKSENKTSQDSVAVDSSAATAVVISPTQATVSKTVTQNFPEYQSNQLTEDERETKVWDALRPLIERYDSANFHALSKNYIVPETEETEDGTVNTSQAVTITLFYDDDKELKAYQKQYQYKIEGTERFETKYSLYLFDKETAVVYEDQEIAIDMYMKSYVRGITKLCPDCGVQMSGTSEVTVSGGLNAKDFDQMVKAAKREEADILEYAYADSFGQSGDEYVYQTAEPLNNEVDYDVFYTASKSYYEKFMKPKLNR